MKISFSAGKVPPDETIEHRTIALKFGTNIVPNMLNSENFRVFRISDQFKRYKGLKIIETFFFSQKVASDDVIFF